MSVPVEYMKAVIPHMLLTDNRLGELSAKLVGEVMGSEIVGVYVGVRGSEKGRGLEEDNPVGGDEFRKVSQYVRL